MITKTYQLDMHSSCIPVVVRLSQYDSDFSLVFELYSSYGTFTIESGTTVEVRGTKSDGRGFSANATLDINNKKVTVTGDQQMTAVPGKNIFELTLWKNNKELNTANFIIDVERAALDRDTIPSESKILELLDVTDRADDIVAAAQSVLNAIDPTLSISGRAADAKAAGDAINDLKDDLDQVSFYAEQTIMEKLRYPILFFEIGNISFYSSGWTYSDKNTRIRTPQGKEIPVEIGDVISLSSYTNARFYMGILTSDGVYHNKGWNTSDVICDYAGKCALLISNITETSITDISTLANLVTITKNSTLEKQVSDINNKVEKIGVHSFDSFSMLSSAEIPFECGFYLINNNVLSFKSSNNVVRMKKTISIALNAGDVISLSDYTNCEFSVVCLINGIYNVYGYRQTDFTCEQKGDYYIQIRYTNQSIITDIYALINLLMVIKSFKVSDIVDIKSIVSNPSYAYDIYPIKGISHRGVQYNAPENTMAAFKLSVENGFKYIETDVQFSSDNIPVLIHDTTVNRTTDGTGNVSDMTYAQLRALDAGSWFGAEFAGEKIPSLEEFLIFCKRTGVYPYLELKSEATYTQTQVNLIISMLRQYDMLNNVTWISWSNDWLNMVLASDKKARVGRARNVDITSGGVSGLNALKTGYNRVFWLYSMTASNITLTDAGIALAKAANQDIEISVISTESDMTTILDALTNSGYISGCLSNGTVDFANVVKDRELI